MRFQVPQFIEIEDKIFGPLTLKQFLYLAAGGGLSFILYSFLPFPLIFKAIFILPVIGFAIALAFYKVNEKMPFIDLVEAAFKYFFSGKLYLWRKEDRRPEPSKKTGKQGTGAESDQDLKEYASIMVPKVSNSKLKDLAWSLDIKESMYSNKNQR